MKSFRFNRYFLLAGVAIVLSFVQLSYSQDTKIVNTFISKQAKTEDAEEYKGARKILRGDVNNDGKQDIVVLYTLEGFGGGNGYVQYLAVFLGSGKTFRHAVHDSVGGKNIRSIDLISVRKQIINLNTLEYLSTDASCCPSKKGKTRFVFRNGKLKEV